jgi:cyanate lyase
MSQRNGLDERETRAAVSATVELYRDRLIQAEAARSILKLLKANEQTIQTLRHGFA